MPSKKLDYLSRYMDGPKNDKKKKKKEKKRKKESKKKTRETSIYVDDEDEQVVAAVEEDTALPLDDAEGEEDLPVVVNSGEIVDGSATAPRKTRGIWEEEAPATSQETGRGTRSRYDSSEEDNTKSRIKTRHDSSDEEEEDVKHRVKRRHDSSDEEDVKTARLKRRHDLDDDQVPEKVASNGKHRRPHDSLDEENAHQRRNQRRRHDSLSDDDDDGRERMASGHAAGLQKGSEFSRKETKIQQKRRQEAQVMVDKYGHGDTVFRDKSGRRVEEPEIDSKARPQLSAQEQLDLNTGLVQKQQQEAQQREWAEIQHSSFARHADDAGLEDWRKSEIRKGDPMAQQATKKQQAASGKGASQQRPVYKGPPAKPNRYGIRPGFRWDGIDRGNSFEDKLLAKQYSTKHKQEQAYRWSSADM